MHNRPIRKAIGSIMMASVIGVIFNTYGCQQEQTPPNADAEEASKPTEAVAQSREPERPKKEPVKTETIESKRYIGGYYRRQPLTEAAMKWEIKEYKMEPILVLSTEARDFFADYPSTWPDISGKNLEWYAWPYNHGHWDSNLQINYTMAVDREDETLYLFTQNWDVTP